jgi:hypothetical protein
VTVQSYGANHWLGYRGTRRIWSYDHLPMPRAFMHGPHWRRYFDVRRNVRARGQEPVAQELEDAMLVFTFEDDVRERVLDEVRPGVVSQWSDPLERVTRAVPRTRADKGGGA